MGLEPTTLRLKAARSTDWARKAPIILFYYVLFIYNLSSHPNFFMFYFFIFLFISTTFFFVDCFIYFFLSSFLKWQRGRVV